MDSLNFGKALEALKEGKKVSREGWNGKGMFAYYVPGGVYKSQTDVIKNTFGEEVKYRPYLALKTVDNDIATWTPSVSDILAEDWNIVE
ncbi:DUF2829 domain-containing protein [Myroides odoratus]|nr:DUF2829 domain-containing protein [Myroides odoratus]